MYDQKATPICRSVFKSGENETTTERFTQMWITLINQLEKSKGDIAGIR